MPKWFGFLGALVVGAVVGWIWLGTCQIPSSAQAAPPKRVGGVSASGYDLGPLPREEVLRLAERLTAEQRAVTLASGTEPPFCGGWLDHKGDGTYACVLCNLPLFDATTKFNSGTGWPSFHTPFDPDHIEEVEDRSHGMKRTEVRCKRCGSHLGHVFDDGPRPSGLRYCINSASLDFVDASTPIATHSPAPQLATAWFAGGCFWGVEDAFEKLPGVVNAISGYMGGQKAKPTYREVLRKDTGHAETVQVTYDPSRVSYGDLLRFFFMIHDPTTPNRQGPDVGPQYRSAIFVDNTDDERTARAFIRELGQQRSLSGRTIVTEVVSGATFWPAEDYHQDYNKRNGRSCHLDVDAIIRSLDTRR